mgnify:CR=1 FL=1
MVIRKGKNPNGFTIPDQDGNDISISDYDDKYKLLSFHPLAWTEPCKNQMQAIEKRYEEFKELNTVPFGISIDPVPTKKAWAGQIGLEKLKILSDFNPLGFVAKIFDVFVEEENFSGRANVLLNPEGEVVWAKEYDIHEVPDFDEVIAAIKDDQN